MGVYIAGPYTHGTVSMITMPWVICDTHLSYTHMLTRSWVNPCDNHMITMPRVISTSDTCTRDTCQMHCQPTDCAVVRTPPPLVFFYPYLLEPTYGGILTFICTEWLSAVPEDGLPHWCSHVDEGPNDLHQHLQAGEQGKRKKQRIVLCLEQHSFCYLQTLLSLL